MSANSSGKITITAVNSDENVDTLRKFRNILQTTMSPSGSSKIIVTGGGYLELTCTSGTLLSRLELENPICRHIGQMISRLPDYGLYVGVLVSRLLEQQWTHDHNVTKQNLSRIVYALIQTLQDQLVSDCVCRKVDFSSIHCFFPLVKTVIGSKPTYLYAGLDIDGLSVEIVKAFINQIDSDKNVVGPIYVNIETGANHFSSYNGLLYQIDDGNDPLSYAQFEGEVKIILFTVKLENELSETNLSTNTIIEILEHAFSLNVKIVCCQKTVSPEIKLYLMRKKLVLLERMGTDFTTKLVQMSQAFPISQRIGVTEISRMLGTLTKVHYTHINKLDYIILHSNNEPIGTLLIRTYSFTGTDHLKTVVLKAIGALRSLLVSPAVTPGGGCLEVWLIAQINLLKKTQMDREFCTIYTWLQHALLSSSTLSKLVMMDSLYHHSWDEEATKCRCGLITNLMLEQGDGVFIPVSEVINDEAGLSLNRSRQPNTSIIADGLVDSHIQKQNALLYALETFANLSDVGSIIYKH